MSAASAGRARFVFRSRSKPIIAHRARWSRRYAAHPHPTSPRGRGEDLLREL